MPLRRPNTTRKLDLALWLAAGALAAYFAYQRFTAPHTLDCQAYDRFGNGIGCEGPDLGDL